MARIDEVLTKAISRLGLLFDCAALDAEILLCMVLKKERDYLRAWSTKHLNPKQITAFENLLTQRLKGVPIAYLTGKREFWSREFKVTADVLIPRADTELLIELSLTRIPKNKPCKIIDLGTGSGVIAITLAAERPYAKVMAIDISQASLQIAKENARFHGLNSLCFQQSNWFTRIVKSEFDFIVSNPPYIAADDPHLHELRFEPQQALISENKGLKDIATIAKSAYGYLKPGGSLLIEHGCEQQQAVQAIFQQFYYTDIQTHTDLANLPRATCGKKD